MVELTKEEIRMMASQDLIYYLFFYSHYGLLEDSEVKMAIANLGKEIYTRLSEAERRKQ